MVLQENMVVADRFRLARMIGKGGMGSVWEARQVGLDRAVAVKFIEGELANLAEAHARFEREAKAAAQLQSQHVVQIFEHGVWQGIPYIAMELLKGEDLGKRLTKSGTIAPGELISVIHQVCRALTKAHAAGIVHRDLKPDNIFMVQEDDGPELVKILDFGVAKQTGQAIDGSNTKTGAMLGTPYYMSPEQARGIRAVDGRSDLWSVGVIVYQCLTGRLPYESEALGDLLFKIMTEVPTRPTDVNPQLPQTIDAWWIKAAEKTPEARFQTAKEFDHALQAALGEAPSGDISERSRMQRLGGGTALMPGAPGSSPALVAANVPNTPFPASNQTAALGTTPNPAFQTPANPGASPFGHGSQPGIQGGMVQSGSYGGVEPPAGATKKGPPIVLLAALGGLAVVGLVASGLAVTARRKHASEAPPAASSTVVAVETATAVPSATVAAAPKEPDPAAPASATATATATGAAKEPDPAANAAGAQTPSSHRGGGAPGGAVAGGPKPAGGTKGNATPSAAAPAKPPPPGAGGVTNHGLGF